MTARILVVDDHIANVKLLEARLGAEYFEVLTALNGADALAFVRHGQCDLIISDVMMPGMDGYELCRLIKADPSTMHVPVVLVTALDQPADRVRGLDAGADDFLTKPIDETALFARVKSLLRLKAVTDELRARLLTSRGLGAIDPFALAAQDDGKGGHLLLVEDRPAALERLRQILAPHHRVTLERDPNKAVFTAAQADFDMVIASLDLKDMDGLRLFSQLRSLERTRQIALLALADGQDKPRIMRALDLGVNDYLLRPVDRNELLARVRTQLRRKRYSDRLRDTLQTSLEMSVRDPLTGLSNRRYFDAHGTTLLTEAARLQRRLTLMMLDLDRFKSINDTYGHPGGDAVLREFAQRMASALRGEHLVARLGGEEFAVLMQDMGLEAAELAADRIRQLVAAVPMALPHQSRSVPVTVSIGLAEAELAEPLASLIARADAALYAAKAGGRNRVEKAPRSVERASMPVDETEPTRQIA